MASSATTAVVEEEDRRPIASATSEAAPMDTSAQDLDPDDISSRARAFIVKYAMKQSVLSERFLPRTWLLIRLLIAIEFGA